MLQSALRKILLSVFCLFLLIGPPAVAQEETDAKKLAAEYKHSFERLESLRETNEGRFTAARAQLLRELKGRIDKQRTLANNSASLADQYRDLARSADAEAKRRLESAHDFDKLANDPLLKEADRAPLRDTADQARKDAAAEKKRAEERRALAVEWRQTAEQQNDVILALQALEQRARGLTISQPEDTAEAEAEPSEAERLEAALNPEDGAHPDLEVGDIVGLWRPRSGPEFPMVIVQKRPGDEAYPHDLEIHTKDRVWSGEFDSSIAGSLHRSQNARIVATYKPQAGEMNANLPDWVAAAVEGQLEWRLEIDETGSLFDPHLKVRWYRGEIRWTEGAEERAWVEGDGVPLIYEMEQEALFDIARGEAVTLWVEPVKPVNRFRPDETDYSTSRISEVIKHQPHKVKVRMPPALAMERGPKIEVQIKGANGSSTTLELIGPRVQQVTAASRGIIYTHQGSVTIADIFSEPERDPQFMSLGYLADFWAREMDRGTRLDLSVENGELVEFTYDGAGHGVFVWNSHIKSGLAMHKRLLATERKFAGDVLSSQTATNEEKEVATLQIRLLNNYASLVAREDELLEKHLYHLGELYLTSGISTAHALCKVVDCNLLPGTVGLSKLSIAQLRQLDASYDAIEPSPAYFTAIVEGFVGALTGTKNTPAGVRMRDAVNWVDNAEKSIVAVTLSGVSNQARQGFQKGVADLAYAIPRGFVDEMSILFTGRNWKGHQVSSADRGLTLSRLVFQALVERTGSLATNRIMRLRQQALSPVGNRKIRRQLLRSKSPTVPPVATATANTATPDAVLRQSVPDVPATVSPQQARQLALPMNDKIPEDGFISCGARERIDLDEGLDGNFNYFDEMNALSVDASEAQRLIRLKSKIQDFYGQTGIDITIEAEEVFKKQIKNTCVGTSTAKILKDLTDEDIEIEDIIREFAMNAAPVNNAQVDRVTARVADLEARKAKARIAGNDTEFNNLQQQIHVENKRLKGWQNYRRTVQNASTPATRVDLIKSKGVKVRHAAAAIRRRGGTVAMLEPSRNKSLKLKHLRALKEDGYGVMVSLRTSDAGVDHAVVISKIDSVDGKVSRVHWFDPAHNATLSAPARDFKKMLATRKALDPVPNAETGVVTDRVTQPALTVFKF